MAFCRAALLAAVLGLAVSSVQAQKRLIVFGDGLADDGMGALLYARNSTGNATLQYPPAPYYLGHFTNGQVIPEYLAQYLGLQLYVYAQDGATSGATSSFFTIQNNTDGVPTNYALPRNINVPSVQDQVATYTRLTSGSISASDYYLIIVGSNDYYDILASANATATDVISYIRSSAVSLYQSGVRQLIISQVPPLQATPFALAQTNATQATLTNLVTQHNNLLSTMVSNLTSTYPQGTFAILPTYTILSSIASNPTRYGYTNATTQCYGTASQAVPAAGAALCASPAAHIFWDRLNPTTAVHQQIAAVAAREIQATLSAPAQAPAGQAPVPAPAGLIAG